MSQKSGTRKAPAGQVITDISRETRKQDGAEEKAEDVTDTLTMTLQASRCDSARVVQRPRLLSYNGPYHVSSDLAAYLFNKGMEHTRGAPCHPQTQGKIERWHQTLKNILLENYFLRATLSCRPRRIDHFNTVATTSIGNLPHRRLLRPRRHHHPGKETD